MGEAEGITTTKKEKREAVSFRQKLAPQRPLKVGPQRSSKTVVAGAQGAVAGKCVTFTFLEEDNTWHDD